MKPEPLGAAAAALALFVSLLWGGNVAAIKFGYDTFPPIWSAFWRFSSAGLAVMLWAWSQGVSLRPQRGEMRGLSILAAMFTAQIVCLNTATAWTSAAYAVVLLNSHPLFTNLFGQWFALEERLTVRRAVGLTVAFAGICWLALGRPAAALAPHPQWGNFLVLISASLLATRVLYTRGLVQKMHPLRTVTWQILLAVPAFLLIAVLTEPMTLREVTWPPVIAILYQGPVIAGFCFIVWTTLLKRHSASTLSMFGFTVPVFGVLLSAWMFGEEIGSRLVSGAALVTLGIVIVTRRPKVQATA